MSRFFLALLFLAGATASAQDRRVAARTEISAERARIVLRWEDGSEPAPGVDAQIKGRVLVMRFDQPVEMDVPALVAAMPNLFSQGRSDADKKGIRLDVTRGVRLYQSRSLDLAAIDLLPEDSSVIPPAIVSPLLAARAKKKPKAKPPPPVVGLDVRVSESGNASRIAFHWDAPVAFRAEEKNGRHILRFAAHAEPDMIELLRGKSAAIADFSVATPEEGLVFALTPASGVTVGVFQDKKVVVIALTTPGTTAGKDEAAEIRKARPDTPPLAPVQSVDGIARTTWLRSNWPSPVPGSGTVRATFRAVENGLDILFPWDKPVPAAVFSRASVVWAVFGAEADIVIDPARIPPGYRIESVPTAQASIVRISPPDGVKVSAISNGPDWTLRFLSARLQAKRSLKPKRLVSDTGRSSIHILLPGVAGLVWFVDPVIGDDIAAAIAFGPTSGLGLGRRLVEAALPVSAHGLAVIPRADDVKISIAGETVIVSGWGGLAVSDGGNSVQYRREGRGPGYMDFDNWGGLSGDAFFAQRSTLEMAAAIADPASPAGAIAFLRLARFFVGHDMGPEALGVIRLAQSKRKLVGNDVRFMALRGVASIMTGRYAAAESDLTRSALSGDKAVFLWRALAAANLGDWARAYDLFAAGEEFISAHVPRWSAIFHAAAAESALHVTDFDQARRHAERASASGFDAPFEHAALVLAYLAGGSTDKADVYERMVEVALMTSDPVSAEADLMRLRLGGELGRISARDVVDGLETLRFRWRGDHLEARTVAVLADQYMLLGQYRTALSTASTASAHDPSAPGAHDLRRRLAQYFRRLFLDDEADRLDPIQAVALFYEFKTLTPIGADGDRMVRKLARRLIAFDLLDQAAELLQHQIDLRVRGPGKSAIAADLALIYLLNRQPERALKALNSTRTPGLDEAVRNERRLLEARALTQLKRYDHAIELLSASGGFDAAWVKGEAYWRKGAWADAARELMLAAGSPDNSSGRSGADIAMRAAIAARMAGDKEILAQLRGLYTSLLDGSDKARSFDLLTAPTDASGASLAEAVRILADTDRLDAFAASIRQSRPSSVAPADEDPA